VDTAIATLRQKLRREPREEEIAQAMNLSLEEYERALEQLRTLEVGSIRQLEAPAADGGSLLELCVDPGEGAVARLERQELREHLARAIQELPERERHIIALYYQEELTLAEIGEVIGVGESRVCQLRSLAVSRLRATLRSSLGLNEVAR
jgi:RNA polymerase sigma factor for flagellar operon FliA